MPQRHKLTRRKGCAVTKTELWRIRLLDWLYDFRPERPGNLARIVDFLSDDEKSEDHIYELLRGVLQNLSDRGLISLSPGMGLDGLSASITDAGRVDVEARRARRADPALRRAATRDALVQWIYRNPRGDLDDMVTDLSTFYEGEPLERDHLEGELGYLLNKDLVTGVSADQFVLLQPEVTDKGVDCVEQYGGSVRDYLRRAEGSATQHNVHFNAPVSGSNVAWDSTNVSQTATTIGPAGDELAMLVRAIAQAIPVLGLEEPESSALANDLQVIDAELVQPEPDRGAIRTLVVRSLGIVGRAGSTALSALFQAYAKDLMRRAGIPID